MLKVLSFILKKEIYYSINEGLTLERDLRSYWPKDIQGRQRHFDF